MSQFNTKILVTGSAGFIGFHLSLRLLKEGYHVIGIDNINPYYDVKLKLKRLSLLIQNPNFQFYEYSLENKAQIDDVFNSHIFEAVVNLAAQAGVRYSLENPHAYVESNIVGFLNILEGCRHHSIGHLIYASSSSVYGSNTNMPFSVHDNVDHPVSLYAVTKKTNELMAHTYSHLFRLPTTGLRFFTVYGPWGRPDMALFLFTKAIVEGQPIQVFNHGAMMRDFTYIDDIVEGIVRLIPTIPAPSVTFSTDKPNPSISNCPYKIYNIGNNQPVKLLDFIDAIEQKLGIKAVKHMLPLQAGDVPETYADVEDLIVDTGFKPSTTVEEGIGKFVDWYLEYYGVNI